MHALFHSLLFDVRKHDFVADRWHRCVSVLLAWLGYPAEPTLSKDSVPVAGRLRVTHVWSEKDEDADITRKPDSFWKMCERKKEKRKKKKVALRKEDKNKQHWLECPWQRTLDLAIACHLLSQRSWCLTAVQQSPKEAIHIPAECVCISRWFMRPRFTFTTWLLDRIHC